jgi:hypothetical protein
MSQAGDGFVDAAVVAENADEADPHRADERRGNDHQRHDHPGRRPADERDGDRRCREAAEHEGTLAADDDHAEPSRHSDAERGEDERRRAHQRVLPRKGSAEAAAPEQVEELGRRLAEDEKKDGEGGSPRR